MANLSTYGNPQGRGVKALSDEAVIKLREDYAAARRRAHLHPEDWETNEDTLERLASESTDYSAHPNTLRKYVIGLSSPDAGGPVDFARLVRHLAYLDDAAVVGTKKAREIQRDITDAPANITIHTLTPGGVRDTIHLVPGTEVLITYNDNSGKYGDDIDTARAAAERGELGDYIERRTATRLAYTNHRNEEN